jgi:hypothetical protein
MASISSFGERDYEIEHGGRQIAVVKTRRRYGRSPGDAKETIQPATDEDRREALAIAERFAGTLAS